MKRKLLHIVDMQNDFILPDGKLSVAGANELIIPANDFLHRTEFNKVIATFDTHYRKTYNQTSESKIFGSHCIYKTHGWELAIQPRNYESVTKNEFDVWAKPHAINKALAGFYPADTEIYVMGVASDFCVKYAIVGYLNRGYNVTVIQDLCQGINKQICTVVKELNNKKIRLITSTQIQSQR